MSVLDATNKYYKTGRPCDIEGALAAPTPTSLGNASIEGSTVLRTCSASVKGKSMLVGSRER